MQAISPTSQQNAISSGVAWPGKVRLLGVRISVTDYSEAVGVICFHARERLGGAVAATSIHGVMLGTRQAEFGRRLDELEMTTPDGQGVRWAMNLLHGTALKDRVYGPTLTLRLTREAARQGLGVYLFGSTKAVCWAMKRGLQERYPGLHIAGVESASAWPWSSDQDEDYTQRIRESGAHIVLVGLGCPRQEQWMHEHRSQLKAVLVGVGAAFDFIAGAKRQAPRWIQKCGLEMAFRTCLEPRRLWRRFFYNSPAFVLLVMREWLRVQATSLCSCVMRRNP